LRLVLGAGLLLALNAHAFTGKVVGVSDGDTITVLRDRTQVKVRLLEIDAPEKAQAFGAKSKESLSEMCFGKTAAQDQRRLDYFPRKLWNWFYFNTTRVPLYADVHPKPPGIVDKILKALRGG